MNEYTVKYQIGDITITKTFEGPRAANDAMWYAARQLAQGGVASLAIVPAVEEAPR